MIFVATGTQFPFDRLIEYMDSWAKNNEETVFAQIGEGEYQPRHAQFEKFISIEDYNQKIQQANIFISHAGMGNIISAKEHNTPIIVVNRQAKLGEHRNDHQTEGLSWMGELNGVYTASTQQELYSLLEHPEKLSAAKQTSDTNLNNLTSFLDRTIKQWAE